MSVAEDSIDLSCSLFRMECVRFTGRVRQHKGHFANVQTVKTDRWVSLCDEVKAKCDEKKESRSAVKTELNKIRSATIDILGSDAKSDDHDELAITLYRTVTQYIQEEAKTQAIEEITNINKLQIYLEEEIRILLLKMVEMLLDSVKIIETAIEHYKPWGDNMLEQMKSPYEVPSLPGFDVMLQKYYRTKRDKEQNDFHMSFDAEAKRLHFESLRISDEIDKVVFDVDWLQGKFEKI